MAEKRLCGSVAAMRDHICGRCESPTDPVPNEFDTKTKLYHSPRN